MISFLKINWSVKSKNKHLETTEIANIALER